jgi:hypothetical protein
MRRARVTKHEFVQSDECEGVATNRRTRRRGGRVTSKTYSERHVEAIGGRPVLVEYRKAGDDREVERKLLAMWWPSNVDDTWFVEFANVGFRYEPRTADDFTAFLAEHLPSEGA